LYIKKTLKDEKTADGSSTYVVTESGLIPRPGINLEQKSKSIRKHINYKKSVADLKKILKVDPEKFDDKLHDSATRNFGDFKDIVLYNMRPEIVKEYGELDFVEILVELKDLCREYDQLHEERVDEWLNYKKSGDIALDSEMEVAYKSALEHYGKILKNLNLAISFIEDKMNTQDK